MRKQICIISFLGSLLFSLNVYAENRQKDFSPSSSFSQARSLFNPQIPSLLLMPKSVALCERRTAFFDPTAAGHFCEKLCSKQTVYSLKKTQTERLVTQPLHVGVIFSGGQAPGGHAVLSGLVDALMELHPRSECIGFLNGFGGLLRNDARILTKEETVAARHTGGFDLLGSGRDKIEGEKSLARVLQVVQDRNLDGLVIIGGDDSNTNALVIADYFQKNNCHCSVVGVPKTIDGDLRSEELPLSFGFDTATKTYSEMIGNLAKDARSAKKQYFFVKLMGRHASHVALECAMNTHPNLVLISEEIHQRQMTSRDVVLEICSLVEERFEQGKSYGVILVPEGLIESMADISVLIQDLNTVLAPSHPLGKELISLTDNSERFTRVLEALSSESKQCLEALPMSVQLQLVLDRDPHGNVNVTKIETEKVLALLVEKELMKRSKEDGKKRPFSFQTFFFGYEGRCQYPTNFDLEYSLSLGRLAACAVGFNLNGYLVTINQLNKDVFQWEPCFVPLLSMVSIEMRNGLLKPVIKKALVDLNGSPFLELQRVRTSWRLNDAYLQPGPIQYWNQELQDKPFIIR